MGHYNRSSGFNIGLAMKVGVTAAIVFDELSFFGTKGSRTDGWVWKGYDEILERLPFLSEFMVRKAYRRLVEAGLIETKIMKVNGLATFHYRILRNFSLGTEKTSVSIGTEKTSVSIYTSSNTASNTQQSELLDVLNQKTGRKFRALPRGVAKLLKTFTLDEVGVALGNMALDPWHKERLGQLSSDYMLRATTIDKFLNIQIKPERKYL